VADAGPAAGRAGRSTDTPRTQAAREWWKRLAPARCRSIARRVPRGGIGRSVRLVWLRPPAYSVSPRL